MYLLIQNSGIAPIESFTVLGVSTARGNTDKIGQFGSGCKHGINLLLRSGINPKIYLGNDELEFFSKPEFMKGVDSTKQYNRICYKFKGQVEKTGFSQEFGELDWDNVEMAIRELVSNAIDAVGVENVVLDIVSETRPYQDATTIYLPLTTEIQRYYNSLSEKFLHFIGKDKVEILEKGGNSKVKIYRKGVFVREVSGKDSLFDYNFGDSVKIDESRNMNDSTCRTEVGKLLGNNRGMLNKYIKTLENQEPLFEDSIYYWNIGSGNICESWQQVFGDGVACDSPMIADLVKKRGINVIMTRNTDMLRAAGVPCAESFVTQVEEKGYKIVPANRETEKNLNKVWRKLEGLGLTIGKPKPKVMNFTSVSVTETVMGYYKDGIVYINLDAQGSFQTILEECAHYITGCGDGTRTFQDFAFNVACRLVKEWN